MMNDDVHLKNVMVHCYMYVNLPRYTDIWRYNDCNGEQPRSNDGDSMSCFGYEWGWNRAIPMAEIGVV